MRLRVLAVLVALVLAPFLAPSAEGSTVVSLDPVTKTLNAGESVVLTAHLQTGAGDSPLLSWGCDIVVDQPGTSYMLSDFKIGSDWYAWPAGDDDGLGGYNFAGILGESVLFSVKFTPKETGTYRIGIGYSPGDVLEQFQDGVCAVTPAVNEAVITAVPLPAPAAMAAVGMGLCVVAGRFRQRVFS